MIAALDNLFKLHRSGGKSQQKWVLGDLTSTDGQLHLKTLERWTPSVWRRDCSIPNGLYLCRRQVSPVFGHVYHLDGLHVWGKRRARDKKRFTFVCPATDRYRIMLLPFPRGLQDERFPVVPHPRGSIYVGLAHRLVGVGGRSPLLLTSGDRAIRDLAHAAEGATRKVFASFWLLITS